MPHRIAIAILLTLSSVVAPKESPSHRLTRNFGYFYAYGSNSKNGAKFATFSTVFGYCTPTHDIAKLRDDEKKDYTAIVQEQVGTGTHVDVSYDGGNATKEAAERSRQRKMSDYRSRGYRTEERTYNLGVYAPAKDCRP